MFENQHLKRSDTPLCPFGSLGLQHYDIVFWKKAELIFWHFHSFERLSILQMSLPDLLGWNFCHYSVSSHNVLIIIFFFFLLQPFLRVPLLTLADTVDTHDTWECARRRSWEAARALMIADGELAAPNPYRAKNVFSSSGFFHHWYIQQVVCHELSLL